MRCVCLGVGTHRCFNAVHNSTSAYGNYGIINYLNGSDNRRDVFATRQYLIIDKLIMFDDETSMSVAAKGTFNSEGYS